VASVQKNELNDVPYNAATASMKIKNVGGGPALRVRYGFEMKIDESTWDGDNDWRNFGAISADGLHVEFPHTHQMGSLSAHGAFCVP